MGTCGNRFRRAFSKKWSHMNNCFVWLIRLPGSSSNRYDEDDDGGKENENNLDRDQLNKAKTTTTTTTTTILNQQHTSRHADFFAAIAQLK